MYGFEIACVDRQWALTLKAGANVCGCTVYLTYSRRPAIKIDTCPGVKPRVAINPEEGPVSRDSEIGELESSSGR